MKRRCYVSAAPALYAPASRTATATAPSIGRLFEHFFDTDVFQDSPITKTNLPMSLWQDENSYFVDVDVPGVKLEDVNITVHNGELALGVKRTQESRENGFDNRTYGEFEQRLTLPQTVNEDGVEAKLANGVLSIRIPKVEQPKPRKVAVKVQG